MSYNLFLDDIRQPKDVGNYAYYQLRHKYRLLEWMIVRNYKEFVECIEKNGLPDLISFDHDLADEHYNPELMMEPYGNIEETGYDCATWLLKHVQENNLELPEILCHSMNPVGKKNILNLFRKD